MRKTLALALLLGIGSAGAARADDARAVVEQAIRAHGGERLARVRTAVRAIKGTLSPGPTDIGFSGELVWDLPERMRVSFDLEAGGQKLRTVVVVNGNRGWRSAGGAVADLTASEFDDTREDAYVFWVETLLPLRERDFQLTSLPEVKVNDKPAAGVKVSRPGRVDVELYFDRDSHLLVKVVRKTKEAGRPVSKESVLGDYKEFEGVKLPTKIIDLTDGRKFAELTVQGYRFPPRPDDSQFAKP